MSDDIFTDAARMNRFEILFTNGQSRHTVSAEQLIAAARAVLRETHYTSAMISLAVVDDATIHELNRQFLSHDWPTDVLSFALQDDRDHLEGEVIISADTAAASAAEIGCTAAAEQLLYVVHGMLHLVGYRDKTPEDTHAMRVAEARFLSECGWDASFHGRCDDNVPLPLEKGRHEDDGRQAGSSSARTGESPVSTYAHPREETPETGSRDVPDGATGP